MFVNAPDNDCDENDGGDEKQHRADLDEIAHCRANQPRAQEQQQTGLEDPGAPFLRRFYFASASFLCRSVTLELYLGTG